jgi:hypothetical protein
VDSWRTQVLALPSPGPNRPTRHEQLVAAVIASAEFFQASGSEVTPWVTSLYTRLLQRPADAGGLDFHRGRILDGYAAARRDVVNQLFASSEYQTRDRSRLVSDAYTKFLGRAATSGDVSFWVGRIQAGLAEEQALAEIAGSGESFQRAGGTNALFVDRLYLELLGRARDAAESFFVGELNAGRKTRVQVATELIGSAEYRRQVVRGLYTTYLRRAATAGDEGVWVPFLQGKRDEAVLAELLASREYFQRA